MKTILRPIVMLCSVLMIGGVGHAEIPFEPSGEAAPMSPVGFELPNYHYENPYGSYYTDSGCYVGANVSLVPSPQELKAYLEEVAQDANACRVFKSGTDMSSLADASQTVINQHVSHREVIIVSLDESGIDLPIGATLNLHVKGSKKLKISGPAYGSVDQALRVRPYASFDARCAIETRGHVEISHMNVGEFGKKIHHAGSSLKMPVGVCVADGFAQISDLDTHNLYYGIGVYKGAASIQQSNFINVSRAMSLNAPTYYRDISVLMADEFPVHGTAAHKSEYPVVTELSAVQFAQQMTLTVNPLDNADALSVYRYQLNNSIGDSLIYLGTCELEGTSCQLTLDTDAQIHQVVVAAQYGTPDGDQHTSALSLVRTVAQQALSPAMISILGSNAWGYWGSTPAAEEEKEDPIVGEEAVLPIGPFADENPELPAGEDIDPTPLPTLPTGNLIYPIDDFVGGGGAPGPGPVGGDEVDDVIPGNPEDEEADVDEVDDTGKSSGGQVSDGVLEDETEEKSEDEVDEQKDVLNVTTSAPIEDAGQGEETSLSPGSLEDLAGGDEAGSGFFRISGSGCSLRIPPRR